MTAVPVQYVLLSSEDEFDVESAGAESQLLRN
jgi:hypothetical protein